MRSWITEAPIQLTIINTKTIPITKSLPLLGIAPLKEMGEIIGESMIAILLISSEKKKNSLPLLSVEFFFQIKKLINNMERERE